MAYKNRTKPIPMTYFNTAGITGSYQPINPDGLPYACVAISIKNYSDFIFITALTMILVIIIAVIITIMAIKKSLLILIDPPLKITVELSR